MTLSPLMQQYWDIKKNYADVLVLFQVGDFYELFYDDAKKAAAFLGITLTKRGISNGEPIPLCGVPVHTVDHYLLKLVRGGFRVAVCNQLTPATPGKVVERGVVQVLTPGTLTDSKFLPEKSASYLAVVVPDKHSFGLACIEILTGQIFVTLIAREHEKIFEAELARFAPDEVVLPTTTLGDALATRLKRFGYVTTPFSPNNDYLPQVQTWLASLTSTAHSFITQSSLALETISLLYGYLQKNQEKVLQTIERLFFYMPDDFMLLDAATQRNLELVANNYDQSLSNTLYAILDRAITAMGSRTIKKWLLRPSLDKKVIEERLDAIQALVTQPLFLEQSGHLLKSCGDLERIVGRVALARAQLHDYQHLMGALQMLPSLRQLILTSSRQSALLLNLSQQLVVLDDLLLFLETTLNLDTSTEWLIKSGYQAELDRLRALVDQGAQAIYALELAEQERTGIQSLKIRYNQAHGYGIEITKANLDRVPVDYIRLQTLVNRERFTTIALKDLEYDINRARRDSVALEQELYAAITAHVATYLNSLRVVAQAAAEFDALVGLATAAYSQNYVRPSFNDERSIIIEQGQHPVVAAQLQHAFIPNDTALTDQETLWIITGPNMGGKSTYLRQVALIGIMAQMGSFVPARRACLPIIDRIFTRIGAADQVAHGKSTFLVEMEETALICNQATANSLVILDEVGRGTSTYDGFAIAQAVVEYIYTTIKARCLFATHYHELTPLCTTFPGIVAYHAASCKQEDGIVLLHKIVRGTAQGSFGIEVAKTAHLPEPIITRAQAILQHMVNGDLR